jgi:hypothetical protein
MSDNESGRSSAALLARRARISKPGIAALGINDGCRVTVVVVLSSRRMEVVSRLWGSPKPRLWSHVAIVEVGQVSGSTLMLQRGEAARPLMNHTAALNSRLETG